MYITNSMVVHCRVSWTSEINVLQAGVYRTRWDLSLAISVRAKTSLSQDLPCYQSTYVIS